VYDERKIMAAGVPRRLPSAIIAKELLDAINYPFRRRHEIQSRRETLRHGLELQTRHRVVSGGIRSRARRSCRYEGNREKNSNHSVSDDENGIRRAAEARTASNDNVIVTFWTGGNVRPCIGSCAT